MLFTTATFAFLYLPIVLIGYFLSGRHSPRAAAAWLFAASLFFYGYWMPEFTLLLLASIVGNFTLGRQLGRLVSGGAATGAAAARPWLTLGIVFNLGLLAYFKYANFFIDNLNAALGFDWSLGRIILPIGISFYTFTQIAFLVDTWSGKVREFRFVHYGLFVTYFPHLVAGPVLHHGQMMPQFADPSVYRFQAANFWIGVAIFMLGLVKKVILADGVAPYADAVFGPADLGQAVATEVAWLGALAYTLQLYFDFSGYSDMAIGLSLMFNIRLPFNFDSPYKATNISDFWRRWHISLSTFLRDYLYIPLGGNRSGPVRRYINLALTMVLGGLWHGASWLFVIWGALHGAYLMVNHAFRAVADRLGWSQAGQGRRWLAVPGWTLTFLAVVVAWVFFRATTLDGALGLVSSMAGQGIQPPHADQVLANAGLSHQVGWLWCVALLALAVAAPNSNAIGEALKRWAVTRPAGIVAVGAGALLLAILLVLINMARASASAFIYFNF